MKLVVLGSTGKTGRLIVLDALKKGHHVIAIARDPEKLADVESERLTVVKGDVLNPAGIASATEGADALLSALGVGIGEDPATLTAGADVVAGLGLRKIIWLGALGFGATRGAAGPIFSPLFNALLKKQIPAKVAAEDIVRSAGGTVVHAPILSNKATQGGFTLVPSADYRPSLIFPSISRSEVAAAMVVEAASPRFGATTAVFSKIIGSGRPR